MKKACGIHDGEQKSMQHYSSKTWSEETTGDLDIDGRITWKHILKERVVMSDDGGHSLFDIVAIMRVCKPWNKWIQFLYVMHFVFWSNIWVLWYKVCTAYMIASFRRAVNENCALLGYYASSSCNSLPTFRNSMSYILDWTDRLSRNVGKELPLFTS